MLGPINNNPSFQNNSYQSQPLTPISKPSQRLSATRLTLSTPTKAPTFADVTTEIGQQLFPGGKAGVELVANIANGIFQGIKFLFF